MQPRDAVARNRAFPIARDKLQAAGDTVASDPVACDVLCTRGDQAATRLQATVSPVACNRVA